MQHTIECFPFCVIWILIGNPSAVGHSSSRYLISFIFCNPLSGLSLSDSCQRQNTQIEIKKNSKTYLEEADTFLVDDGNHVTKILEVYRMHILYELRALNNTFHHQEMAVITTQHSIP